MAALTALTFAAVEPDPEAYVRINCPFIPVFFADGVTEIEAPGLQIVAEALQGIRLGAPGAEPRIALRTGTSEPSAMDIGALSEARADRVRRLLIENGIAPDHILISHNFREPPSLIGENRIGGWVQIEYYISRAELKRMFPPGGPVC